MNNLLKFLLTFALLLCAIFSIMLMVGCEENTTTLNIKACEKGQVYNDIIGNCVLRHCEFDVYYSDEDAELIGFHGCYSGCYIELNNHMRCYYVLNQSEINELKTLD